MTDKLIIKKEGPIGYMIFNNPEKLNAISLDMWEGMSTGMKQLEADDEVKVIVIKGSGEKAFIAGADVSKYEEERMGDNAQEHYAQTGWEGMMAVYNSSKTTIAGAALRHRLSLQIAAPGRRRGGRCADQGAAARRSGLERGRML